MVIPVERMDGTCIPLVSVRRIDTEGQRSTFGPWLHLRQMISFVKLLILICKNWMVPLTP